MNSIQIFLQTDHSLFIEQRLGSRQRLADLLQEEISPGQAKQRGNASLFCYGRVRGTARDPTDRRIVCMARQLQMKQNLAGMEIDGAVIAVCQLAADEDI